MREFKKEYPPINIGADISVKSFQIIKDELKNYPKAKEFNKEELEVIARLIHTTSCFDEVLDNIYFSKGAVSKIKELLESDTKIIVDVNMIKVGVSEFYLKKYNSEIICYVNEPFAFELAKRQGRTRSYVAVEEAIKQNRDKPLILACGNAPTFIYSAINTLIDENIDLKRVALILFPVGFVNVIEAKDYGKRFSDFFDVASIIMEGRFGSSTMVVATLHAIYRLIKDYDGKEKYNGK